MAKGTGAGAGTYGALTVANKDYKPIDYGKFAEGFADVAIDTRKRKDETLDALSEKYGEVFGTDRSSPSNGSRNIIAIASKRTHVIVSWVHVSVFMYNVVSEFSWGYP